MELVFFLFTRNTFSRISKDQTGSNPEREGNIVPAEKGEGGIGYVLAFLESTGAFVKVLPQKLKLPIKFF